MFLETLIREGANIYQLFDSWAGELARGEYETWSERYHEEIFAACRAVPSILLVRECPYLDLITRSGANVVSLGTSHDLAEAKSGFPTLCFQGNVDHDLLASGTREQVRQATETCLGKGAGRRHVLNLNHGVDRSTPVENFAEFVTMARDQTSRITDRSRKGQAMSMIFPGMGPVIGELLILPHFIPHMQSCKRATES